MGEVSKSGSYRTKREMADAAAVIYFLLRGKVFGKPPKKGGEISWEREARGVLKGGNNTGDR